MIILLSFNSLLSIFPFVLPRFPPLSLSNRRNTRIIHCFDQLFPLLADTYTVMWVRFDSNRYLKPVLPSELC
ncbi:hypothetical protein BKA69DRAFT_1091762 [Paraphysoderma sedebokerense]|nr:hypothetical protein BKA69DRAFT_1091762 [Paraphysoderma sedebokerense]